RTRSMRSATGNMPTSTGWRACASSDEVAYVGVDRDRLAGDVLAGVAAEKEHHVGDVLLGHGGMQAGRLEEFFAKGFVAQAMRTRLGGNVALDALAFDDAGKNGVDPHLVRPGFDRQALGEADDAPLRRRV